MNGTEKSAKVQLKESEYLLVAELCCINYVLELNNEETLNDQLFDFVCGSY